MSLLDRLMRGLAALALATVALVTAAGAAGAFEILTRDKEARFAHDPRTGAGSSRIRIGADRELHELADPRCPATTTIRISSYRFGDLYTKAGRVADAVRSYEGAASTGVTAGWRPEFIAHARELAAQAPVRAALYGDHDPVNDPPFTDLGGAGNCAYCHNR